jgi:hypothetical protein
MSENDDLYLSITVGGRTVGENLRRAIESGKVIRRDDGKLELSEAKPGPDNEIALDPYIRRTGDFGAPCTFLNRFMFKHVYAEAAVPFGCKDCYKVKVVSNTMRQLMAVKGISESIPCTAKSGPEIDSSFNQHLYGSYFYNWGLAKARELYKVVRAKIDSHSKLGPHIKMLIKRGCTNYERKCGPSDQYTFDSRLEEVERYLSLKFVTLPPTADALLDKKTQDGMRVIRMMHAAYQVGDNTYEDFNGGRSLHPPVVTYSPE